MTFQEVRNSLFKTVVFSNLRFRIWILIIALVSATLGILSPYFQRAFVDKLMGETTIPLFWEINNWQLWGLIVAAGVCAFLAQILGVSAIYIATKEGVKVQELLSDLVYKKALELRHESLKGRQVGEIVSLFAVDTLSAVAIIDQTLPMAAGILFPIILAPLFLKFVFQIPVWPVLLAMVFITAVNVAMAVRQIKFFSRFKDLAAQRTGLVSEWIQNIRALRILGWTELFEEKIFKKREEETTNRLKMMINGQSLSTIGSSVSFFVNLVGMLTVTQLTDRKLSPGEITIVFWILGVFLARPLRGFPWLFVFGLDAVTSVIRLAEYLTLTNSTEKQAFTKNLPSKFSEFSLNVKNANLTVKGKALLNNISFNIKDGEFVAFVGEVGSGKSLLLLSLIGETSTHFDEYKIGDLNAKQLRPSDLKSLFTYVPQEGFVMSASLRENVGFEYGIASAKDPEILSALNNAQFDLTRENFFMGLDTEIGERGVNLSGGQKQRVSLARSDFFDRPIILLDDCFSALDPNTEKDLLAKVLHGKWKNKTRILTTHRFSVLEYTDRVIFLEEGKIVLEGKFKDLMAQSSKFRHFVASTTPEVPLGS